MIDRARIIRNMELRSFFNAFFHSQSAGGLILLFFAVIAVLAANIPGLSPLHEMWEQEGGISIGDFSLNMSMRQWVNDGLMAIFFFVVGLEIKREVLVGELSDIKHATLPIFAAVGGMLVPALIFAFFNHGTPTEAGWGIPMATDIAFAVGIISLLGKRCPLGIKVFLIALAIVDDLGSIFILAIFYPSHEIHFVYFIYIALLLGVLVVVNRLNLKNQLFYIIPGILVWYFVLQSGVHSTIAGVLLAITVPARTSINELRFYVRGKSLMEKFKQHSNSEIKVLANFEQHEIIHKLKSQVDAINPMMHRFEAGMHPWVNYVIIPLFALANAGVVLDSSLLEMNTIPPLAMGISLGLLVGKPLGICLFSYISVKLKLAELPLGAKWRQIFALGVIAGIGFTMSIFINGMAFDDSSSVNLGKATILMTSIVSALLGLFFLHIFTAPEKKGHRKRIKREIINN